MFFEWTKHFFPEATIRVKHLNLLREVNIWNMKKQTHLKRDFHFELKAQPGGNANEVVYLFIF